MLHETFTTKTGTTLTTLKSIFDTMQGELHTLTPDERKIMTLAIRDVSTHFVNAGASITDEFGVAGDSGLEELVRAMVAHKATELASASPSLRQ